MNQALEKKVHFFNLDVLRCIAVFMVMFYHGWLAYRGWIRIPTPLATPDGKDWNALGKYINQLVENFDLGVEFFFLISGFLITYLLLQEKSQRGSIHIGKFYWRRTLRIWPLYFFVLGLTYFWCPYANQPRPDYIWPLTFTSNYEVISKTEWLSPVGHFWSISVEEHFYLVWPLLILLVPQKKMPLLFAGVIFLSIAFRIFIRYYSTEWYNHINLNTLARVDVMAIGAWIAWRHHTHPIELKVPRMIRILFYATALFLLCTESNKNIDGGVFYIAIKKYVYALIFLFALLNYLFNPDAFFNFKKKNPLHYLGKISFGIYLYHNLLFPWLPREYFYPHQYTSFYLFMGMYFAIVIAVSALTFELLEKPILKFKDRFAFIKTYR